MRKPIFKTFFARMLTTYLTVIFLLLFLMGITVSSMFNNQYMQEEEDRMRKEVTYINQIIVEYYPDTEKRKTAEDLLATIARQYDALICWVDSKGNLKSFYDEDTLQEKWGAPLESMRQLTEGETVRVEMPGLELYPAENMVRNTRGGLFVNTEKATLTETGVFLENLFEDIFDVPTLTFVRPLMNNGKPDGMLLMHLDLRAVNASITQVYLDVLLISLLAVVVAVLAVYYLTTRMTKPITNMSKTVRRYSKGDFDLRLNYKGTDEIAQLGRSFNAMANSLSTLEQTRRSFVANVSHELRSPLTSISGFLEAIQDGTIPPEKQPQYIDLVIAETRRMTGMVNDLLDLARMESGQNPLHLAVFDINELALRTLLTFEARVNSKQLQVDVRLHQPNCFVEADSDQIAQVLRNLIDNAIKFSPEGGRLIISTALQERRSVLVSVQDSGVGIPQEDLPHVFQRFYKAEKAHTPSAQSGTGLGLSIVRAIMDRHDQDIWVTSKPGQGTTFTFTLKYAPDVRRRAAEAKENRNKDGQQNGI